MAWEYETLFDVEDMSRMSPLEQLAMMEDGDRWTRESTGIRKGQMGYRTRTIKAGPRLEAEIYPIFGKEAEDKARRAKEYLTPEKIQRHNDEQQRRKLVRLIDANFGAGDLSLTLTYEGEAPGFERCEKDVKNFVERVRRRRKKKGLPDMKYIYAIEDVEEGRKKNTHCHLITTGDLSREELREIWEKRNRRKNKPEGMAGFCNIDILQPGKEGLEAIARYLYNQNRERDGQNRERKGKRKYSPSKNLKKPKTRISDTKVSTGKVKRLSRTFVNDESEARRIMEKLYPGYEYVRGTAKTSDIVDGVYIRVLMRKRGGQGHV